MSKRLRESKSSEQWENHLRSKRAEANLSQGDLAKRVGLTRQALYSIETNQYLPSTEVSLRLARVLNCSVEDLFRFGDGGEVICADFIGSLPATDCPIRAKIAKVGTRMVARPISALGEFLNFTVPADGLVLGPAAGKRQSSCQRQVRLQLLHDQRAIDEQIVLAGCDPAMFLAGEHFRRIHRLDSVVSWNMSSTAAIDALKRGEVHVAGLHLVDRQSGQSNLPYLKRHLRKGHFMVVRFTTWEQGLIVGRGNPKGLRRVADLARRGVRFVNREEGSGARQLLDDQLASNKMSTKHVNGYNYEVLSHLTVGRHILEGRADVGIGVRSAAQLYGLDFLPLREEHYDLVIPTAYFQSNPSLARFLDTLVARQFRTEMQALGGYDTRQTGKVLDW